ncbi:hypothetical protein PVK06_027204 [Gossypium arboreum]|uniref:Uncharacterized protein n=1 Tax=Gossypium arboreum TaxID=29729 RepID=A0ABR0NZP0_GOSAR|nr:hypothetical protein PVK06_027204 [Gossypium arboreum]
MKPADLTMEPRSSRKVGCASGFEEKGAMQKQLGRVNAASKVHCEHFDSVLNSDLLAWQVPFRSRNEGVVRMGGGEYHGSDCKAHDNGTRYAPWRSIKRWGSFSLRELARFKELLEKPVRLKPGWPDNEYMAT